MLCCLGEIKANTYYFSSSSGDDSRSAEQAQNPSTPWKTLDRLNALISNLGAGDSILLKRDDVFDGSIFISKSGTSSLPIVIAAYGQGAKPVINGFSTPKDWSAAGNGIWETMLSSFTMVNSVLVNGESKAIGRYPNSNAANKGYLSFETTTGNYQITDQQLPASPDWTGGDVVIRKARWVLDRNQITQHSGNTINYISESGNWPPGHAGYFIENHPSTLDLPGEWYYKLSERKFGIYSPSSNPSSSVIKVSTVNTLVLINSFSNVVFDNLSFQGANVNAFEMNYAQQITITNCDFLYSGVNAITVKGCSDITIQNCLFDHTNNVAINAENSSRCTIRNNTITNTGIVAGMGKGDSGSYEAIMLVGDDMLVEGNIIENTGYIPVTFRGNSNIIRNNYINNFAIVKDDGGGIYTWNNVQGAAPTHGSKIVSNVILNGIGAGEGTDDSAYKAANGIYMDDNTAGVEITGNTVANMALYGIYIHNAHEISLTNNTLFNNKSQLEMSEDGNASYSAIRNNNIHDNIFFSKEYYQPVAEFKTPASDIGDFGVFDNNYYARPTEDNYVINASFLLNGSYVTKALTLDNWKALFAKDNASKNSPIKLSSPDFIRFEYNPASSAKTVSLDDIYIDVSGKIYSGQVTLGAFSSLILLKKTGAVTDNIPSPSPLCAATGSILQEQWNNIPGNSVPDIPLQTTPASTRLLNSLETNNLGDQYGERIRGYICPPQSGSYYFLLAADDAAELWLSTDDNPANKKKIASLLSFTEFHEWNKFPSQKSAAITLQEGQRYYIEVLHKEGGGGDHVTVAWQFPNGALEIPVAGNRLSPYASDSPIIKISQAINFGVISSKTFGDAPFAINASATSGLPVSFRIVSGPASVVANTIVLSGAGTVVVEASQPGDANYNAAPVISQSFSVFAPSVTPQPPGLCSATGSILEEKWENAIGNDVPNIPLQTTATSTSQLTTFETSNLGEQYGERIRGYLCPPQTGSYTFMISGDDAAELWLSTDDNPSNKIKIASFLSYTDFHQFDKFPSQTSAPITLQAGHRYYIEALHKEGGGGDHITVVWKYPDGSVEIPIAGSHLSPYSGTTATSKAEQSISFAAIAPKAFGDQPFTVSATASSGLPVSFRIISGPATISSNTITLNGVGTIFVEASQSGDMNYNAASPVTQSFTVSSVVPEGCSATGSILEEKWENTGGNDISNIPLQAAPSSMSQITAIETSNLGDQYGERIRGYLCPPLTGAYTFFISGDDAVELWLSTDDNPSNKVKIASLLSYTDFHQFDKFSSQTSGSINLQGGHRYYIEVLHKEGGGGDHVTVAWRLPNGVSEIPIPGSRLSPYTTAPVTVTCSASGSILREQWDNIPGDKLASVPYQSSPNSTSELSSLESPINAVDNYGLRIRGYLCAPQTGDHTFLVAGHNTVELWLSTDDNPSNKIKIATQYDWAEYRNWNKYYSQKSAPITLQAGRRYYVEVLYKQGEGGDYVTVAWQLPGGIIEAPIPGSRLSPYVPDITSANFLKTPPAEIKINGQAIAAAETKLLAYPNPFRNSITISVTPAASGDMRLELYDLQGRPVQHLYSGRIERGVPKLINVEAGTLSDGVYIIHVITKDRIIYKRITLAR